MGTVIRPDISRKNKYWIDKHRHYELKHFCLQYPEWKKAYHSSPNISLSVIDLMPKNNAYGDPASREAIKKIYYKEKMELIEQTAINTDQELHNYILKAVTEGLSYTYLKSTFDIPCGKDLYYN